MWREASKRLQSCSSYKLSEVKWGEVNQVKANRYNQFKSLVEDQGVR
jgi:hypothetical protein